MATGDLEDIKKRIYAVLPNWFDGTINPVLDGILAAYEYVGTFSFDQLEYVKNQTRISTASDNNLDAISLDYFGFNGYPRGPGENDESYRARILATILQERATRHGMETMLLLLTGRAPQIFEPQRAMDSGGYSVGGAGYDLFGQWSNANVDYQSFILVFNPIIRLVSSIAGYNIPQGAYNTPSQAAYLSPNSLAYVISQGLIYDQINKTKVEGTISWIRFSN